MIQTLIQRANASRTATVRTLVEAIREGSDISALVAEIKTEAASPRSLGFSRGDLQHHLTVLESRLKGPVWKLGQINRRAVQNNGQLDKGAAAYKRDILEHVHALSGAADILRAEIKARTPKPAYKPAPKAPAPAPAAHIEAEHIQPRAYVSYKTRKAAKKSAAKKPRTETTLASFEELAEAMAFKELHQ